MKMARLFGLALVVGSIAVFAQAVAQQEVTSLRGKAADAPSVTPELKKWQTDHGPIEREYVQQPPLIPHDITGYRIDLKSNKCLTCHSWANYKKSGAVKISQTHFSDREGNDLANISARRYFCTQCHVPQTDAKPLVNNTFKPIRVLRH